MYQYENKTVISKVSCRQNGKADPNLCALSWNHLQPGPTQLPLPMLKCSVRMNQKRLAYLSCRPSSKLTV